jgi:hypothetical protein
VEIQMPRAPSEKTIEQSIKKYLDSLSPVCKIWYFKVHGSMYQESGVPDIVGCICLTEGNTTERQTPKESGVTSCLFAIELKKPGEQPSPIQRLQMRQINEAGGLAFVAYSVEDVQREFARHYGI